MIVGSGAGASAIPLIGSGLGSSGPQSVNIGGQTVPISYVPSGAGIVLPNGATIAPGSAASYNGQQVSLASSGSALVAGGSTIPLSGPVPTGPGSSGTVNIGGQAVSYSKASSGSGIVLGNGETIVPGAAAATINGVPVSLAPGGSALAIGSNTVTLGSSPARQTLDVGGSGALQSITIGNQVIPISYAANGVGIVLSNGQTLSAGESTNMNGVPISLASGENFIVEGTSTIPLTAPAAEQSITLGSNTMPISYAPDGQGIVLPNGQTLHPGQETIISGTTVSLAPGETAVVVDGTTEILHPGAFTTGIGSYVASGIGLPGTGASGGSYTIPGGAPGSTEQAAGSGAESLLKRKQNLWVLMGIAVVFIW